MKRLLLPALAALTVLSGLAQTRSRKSEVMRNIDLFSAVVKQLETNYVDTINLDHATQTAIESMLDELDPYTEYIPRSAQAQFRSITSGEYAGIGSYIQQHPQGGVIISGPHPGSPAEQAGLRTGDRIVRIDSMDTRTWSSDKVSDKLKGQPGTTVRVQVIRPYTTDSLLTFDIVRRKIFMPSVPYYGMVSPGVGYIALSSFTEQSPREVREALEALRAQGLNSLILDLRGNGGGLLESAVQILGTFLPKGTEVLRTRGKGVLNEKVYKTTTKPVDTKLPLAILIDGSTASASEITAGAIQDLDRGVIIGSRSFGKGLVQGTVNLPYDGLLKVTQAKYYIPSGRLIQAIDYSHRNPDGSVGRVPDSLTTEFTTAHGRKVRDGGGIVPDITVSYPDINRLTYNVVRDNWASDFATLYRARHDAISSPAEFVVDDTIYGEFKQFIDPARFDYDKVCETMLQQLRKAAVTEGYMNDSVSAQFDLLEGMLRHSLDHDLDVNRETLTPYLTREIVARYYNTPGEIQAGLRFDPAITRTIELLADPEQYTRLLRPQP